MSAEASVSGLQDGSRYEYSLHLGAIDAAGNIKRDSLHDVAVVRFGTTMGADTGRARGMLLERRYVARVTQEGQAYPYGGPKEMLKTYDEVEIGNDILVSGYPSSLGLKRVPQLDFDLPLAHRGIVAGKNPKNHTIVVDVAVYPGNSAGPVIGTKVVNSETWYVPVGLITEFVPFDESHHGMARSRKSRSINTTSTYSIAEPLDRVIDILAHW